MKQRAFDQDAYDAWLGLQARLPLLPYGGGWSLEPLEVPPPMEPTGLAWVPPAAALRELDAAATALATGAAKAATTLTQRPASSNTADGDKPGDTATVNPDLNGAMPAEGSTGGRMAIQSAAPTMTAVTPDSAMLMDASTTREDDATRPRRWRTRSRALMGAGLGVTVLALSIALWRGPVEDAVTPMAGVSNNPLWMRYQGQVTDLTPDTLPPLSITDAGPASVRKTLDLAVGELGQARELLSRPWDQARASDYLVNGATLPPNLRLLRYLTVARHPAHGALADLPPKSPEALSRLLRDLLSSQHSVPPSPRLVFPAAAAYGLDGVGILDAYIELARRREHPRLFDAALGAYALAFPEAVQTTPPPLRWLLDGAPHVAALSDTSLVALTAVGAPGTDQATDPGAAARQSLLWERQGRAGISADAHDAAARYMALLGARAQNTPASRWLRDALWALLAGVPGGAVVYLEALAQAEGVAVGSEGNPAAADRRGVNDFRSRSGQLRDLGPAKLREGNEYARLWHRLLVALKEEPTRLRDWQPALFANAMPGADEDPLGYQLAHFVMCYATPDGCRPWSSAPPAPDSEPAPRPQTQRPNRPPRSTEGPWPKAFWADAATLSNQTDWEGVGPEVLLPMTGIERMAAPRTFNRPLVPLLRSRLADWLATIGMDRSMITQIDWWITQRSGWDPAAIDFNTRRAGLLLTPCGTVVRGSPIDCDPAMLMDYQGRLEADTRRLLALFLSRDRPDLPEISKPVQSWAVFFAGSEAVVNAQRLAAKRADHASDPAAAALLRRHWYLLLKDTDLALQLAAFAAAGTGGSHD